MSPTTKLTLRALAAEVRVAELENLLVQRTLVERSAALEKAYRRAAKQDKADPDSSTYNTQTGEWVKR
jgi:hypothetical protein